MDISDEEKEFGKLSRKELKEVYEQQMGTELFIHLNKTPAHLWFIFKMRP